MRRDKGIVSTIYIDQQTMELKKVLLNWTVDLAVDGKIAYITSKVKK